MITALGSDVAGLSTEIEGRHCFAMPLDFEKLKSANRYLPGRMKFPAAL